MCRRATRVHITAKGVEQRSSRQYRRLLRSFINALIAAWGSPAYLPCSAQEDSWGKIDEKARAYHPQSVVGSHAGHAATDLELPSFGDPISLSSAPGSAWRSHPSNQTLHTAIRSLCTRTRRCSSRCAPKAHDAGRSQEVLHPPAAPLPSDGRLLRKIQADHLARDLFPVSALISGFRFLTALRKTVTRSLSHWAESRRALPNAI
ncbi:hypothetical protein AOQ84DRAFT_3215 [Glonium stellatum]|uniref:Uncharacterized protein n=1 Tax=Glonium stellatum TaxID=574774 RepID=A0A8E2F475_9PEZI|nr:hypothetical protein AOQ84DRAFT_3215 [Glonium stellatum]